MSLKNWFERTFPQYEPQIAIDLSPKAKPRLAVVNRAPSREEFAAWRDDAVTLFVMAALRRMAVEQFEAWSEKSWAGGDPDEMLLLELRTRADAYNAIEESDYEAFCDGAGVEPEGI